MAWRLECTVQRYSWGDPSAIPAMLGVPGDGGPQAELWMGAHPSAPSLVEGQPLDERIAADCGAALGCSVDERFGQLPLLLKVLAAAGPLSIQVHPSLAQARAGFAREESLGIGRGAADRTYKDPNHKPELVCALTDFEALCGFRPVAETLRLLDRLGCHALEPLRLRLSTSVSDEDALRSGIRWLLGLGRPDVETLVPDVVGALSRATAEYGREFVAEFAAYRDIARSFPGDIGVVVALLLNHIVLQPGQAIFFGPGIVHAYLRGVGIEVMANSDNVVRGGLTAKHIDVAELLDIIDTRPSAPMVQTARSEAHCFDAPVPEFALTRIGFDADRSFPVVGPAIMLVTSGMAELEQLGAIGQGEAVFVPASDGSLMLAVERGALVWVATPGPAAVG
ncbi:MAG: mannose-6-phosphate isomerase, class I [Actinomycetota bacterium]|nr:mannose-6-phosphate isomerase, class I [Actinomycetota bacterium]